MDLTCIGFNPKYSTNDGFSCKEENGIATNTDSPPGDGAGSVRIAACGRSSPGGLPRTAVTPECDVVAMLNRKTTMTLAFIMRFLFLSHFDARAHIGN